MCIRDRNKVTLKAEYTENAPKTYELKVTDAQVTLKDGGAVAAVSYTHLALLPMR